MMPTNEQLEALLAPVFEELGMSADKHPFRTLEIKWEDDCFSRPGLKFALWNCLTQEIVRARSFEELKVNMQLSLGQIDAKIKAAEEHLAELRAQKEAAL